MTAPFRPDQMYGLPGQGLSLPQWLVDPITDDELAMRYPGTNGDPVSAGEVGMAPPAMPSPQGPGWQARLFGGADPLAGGMLNPQDARGQGRQALRDFGINLLMNSGPHPFKRGIGELLGTALQAGQQSYQQGVQSVGQRLQAAREMALRERNAATQEAFALQRLGGGAQRPVAVQTIDDQGRPVTQFVVPREGEEYQRPAPTVRPVAPRDGLSSQQILSQVYDPFTVKTINAYNQFQSHLAEARRGNPAAYKSAVSAFITNAEPNNQLRLGMLQYLQEVDPSVQGRADIALQKLQNGSWPASVLDGMQRVVEDNYRQMRQRTQGLYDDLVARNPISGRAVPPPSVRFGETSGGTTPRTPTGTNINPITGRPRGQ